MTEPSTPTPHRRRRIFLILAALVLIPLLLALAGLVALRSAAVRRSILTELTGYLQREYGLVLEAEDFDARWGGFSMDQVRVGAPGAAPLLTASRLDVAVDMRTLRSPVQVIRSLEIDDARLDLSAPVPKIPDTGPPGFEIRRLVLRRGMIVGAPPEPPVSEHVRSWRVDEVEGGGSFVDGLWDLKIESSRVHVDRPGFEPLVLQTAVQVEYRDGQPVRISALRAAGGGLRLDGSGTVGLEGTPLTPLIADFDVQAEPRLLVAGAPPGGSLRARGGLRLPEATGRIAIVARDVPAEVLRPYLEPALFQDLSLAGTVADARAGVALGPESLARVAGQGEATWRRQDRQLVRMDFGVEPGVSGMGEAIRLTAEGDLLPGSPGKRHLRGVIEAAGWTELASATAERIDAEVRLPDVQAALAEVRTLWPRLVPAIPETVPVQGSLQADLRASGSLASPLAKVDATWLPEPGSRVHLKADGRPATWTGSARVEMENVALAGRLSGVVDIAGSPRSYRTKVNATVIDASYPPYLDSLDRAHVTADGSLRLKPLTYTGTVNADGSGLFARPNASDTARLDTFTLAADGTLRVEPLSYKGRIALDGTGLDAPGMVRAERFRLDGDGTFVQALTPLSASARLDASEIELSGATLIDLHAEVVGEGNQVRISSLSGSLPEGRTFAASGRFTVEPLLEEVDLDLRLVKPVDPVREAELTATLRNGTVELSAPRIDTDAGPASLRATVPLGALARIPELAEALAALPIQPAAGEISVQVQAPSVDSKTLLAALGMEPRPEWVRAGVSATLTFDPAAPAAGRGEVRIDGLTLESEDGRVAAEEPVIARLEGGRVELRPVRLRIESGEIGATSIDASGAAVLDPAWKPFEDAPAAVIRTVSGQAGGTLDAALLNPFLEGGEGSGSLSFTASASGPLDRLEASFSADGTGASFVFPAAAVQIENPTVSGRLAGETWSAGGNARLNGGGLAFGARPAEGGALVSLNLDAVPYRLDYGLTARISGLLALQVPLPFEDDSRMALGGTVVVDRGVLVQDINLDREVFTLLLAPEETPGTEETLASRIDLDLSVTTRDGIRVRNNVADLHANWGNLKVTGTAEVPEIRGRVDLDPGGLLYIYGQTARIDRGTLIFTGNPLEDPLLDLSTTSSLQDPTIAQLRGTTAPLDVLSQAERDPLEKEGPDMEAILASGLTGYYGARVFSRFGESVGLSRISVRPVLVYGETDPTARLTVGGDFSRHASFAFSVDLRNAERRTWLLNLHGFRGLPGLALEGFTTDLGGQGGSLQQALDFGGSREPREEGPRLRRLRLSLPPGITGITKLRLRRAIPLRRKGTVSGDSAFDIEVDLAELLRRLGYPDARVTAEIVPVEDRHGWVDVNVAVADTGLGPRVRFVFEGDRPPRAFRSEILAAYRADFYEQRSVEEMTAAAVRAFRTTGHVDPRVEVRVERERPGDPLGPRTVVIRSEAGARVGLEELEIAGVDQDVSRLVAVRFPGRLSRAELAAGLPGADRRLLETLGAQGYPGARIVGRDLDTDRLTVRVEAGERRTFGRIEILGVEDEERERLTSLISVQPGEPARWDLVIQGALRLQDSLQSRGYPDAAVRVEPPAKTGTVDVRYEVTPGERVVLSEVGFEGERWTRSRQLARAAGLKPGEPLNSSAVAEARSRLYQTGAFSRVTADVDRSGDGQARVTFSVAESPRFHIGYGVRYESGSSAGGTAGVVDAVDSNFLGRGLTLGLRALYEPDDRSGRLFLRTGGLFGTGISVETYGLVRSQILKSDRGLGDLQQDIQESALQFSRPFSRRTIGQVYFRYRTIHLFELEPDPLSPSFEIDLRRPYMGMQILWDGRNDKVDPTAGEFRSLDLSGSGPFLGSDFNYVRLYGQWSLYRTFRFAGRPVVWAQGVRPGVAQAFGGKALIEDDRFLVGGEFSVRGYDTESLRSVGRPEEEALLVLNQELRFPLPFDLTGLVFFDAGQVWDDLGEFGTDLAKALGLGLRVKTPVGLLRFDAAFPLDRRPGDESYKLYFGFGNAF